MAILAMLKHGQDARGTTLCDGHLEGLGQAPRTPVFPDQNFQNLVRLAPVMPLKNVSSEGAASL
jgi:hypothetical protein